MSKSLKSYKISAEKESVISRRIHEEKGGLGYLAACEARSVKPVIKK
jgi:hypothetical protein